MSGPAEQVSEVTVVRKRGSLNERNQKNDLVYVLALATVLVLVSAWPQLPPVTGLPPMPFVSSVAWSPDGKRVATADAGPPKVWDAETGKELLTLSAGSQGVLRACASAQRSGLVSDFDRQYNRF